MDPFTLGRSVRIWVSQFQTKSGTFTLHPDAGPFAGRGWRGWVAWSATCGGFLAAGRLSPDHGDRLLLLRSGDVETNPGPDPGESCASCGLSMGTYRLTLRCDNGCGAVSHRRKACSGLERVDQNRGIWRCIGCSPQLRQGGAAAPGVVANAGPVLAAAAPQGIVAQVAPGQMALAHPVSPRELAEQSVISTGGAGAGEPVSSTLREQAGASVPSTAREQAGDSVSSTLREQTGEPVDQGGLSGAAGRNSPAPEHRGVVRPSLPGLRDPPNGDGGTPPARGRGRARQSPPRGVRRRPLFPLEAEGRMTFLSGVGNVQPATRDWLLPATR